MSTFDKKYLQFFDNQRFCAQLFFAVFFEVPTEMFGKVFGFAQSLKGGFLKVIVSVAILIFSLIGLALMSVFWFWLKHVMLGNFQTLWVVRDNQRNLN